jgi:hypothetical protein
MQGKSLLVQQPSGADAVGRSESVAMVVTVAERRGAPLDPEVGPALLAQQSHCCVHPHMIRLSSTGRLGGRLEWIQKWRSAGHYSDIQEPVCVCVCVCVCSGETINTQCMLIATPTHT